jgi:2-methylcitrate dehydratase
MKEQIYALAQFVAMASFGDLSEAAVGELKIRVLDSLACAIGALDGKPLQLVRSQLDDFGGNELCTLIGGSKSAPDRAAFYNGALIRYLDFNDSYLAKGETCHPSDNLSAVLAASEYARGSGKDLLTALAVAYQVQCRLSDEAPVRQKGFDHTTQGAYAVAAGAARALELDEEKTAHALAISGTAYNALRVTRTGKLSHWKGLAYPNTAAGATHAAFLAMRGITGPLAVWEGNKGFMDTIAGKFEVNWSKENLERVRRTIIKKYNAEVHSQSAAEGILEMKSTHGFATREIQGIEIEIFDVAYHIIGGGQEGDKTQVDAKEEADHSLPYIVSAALLDGQIMPEQYHPDRIRKEDIQSLLRKVTVKPSTEFSRKFPEEMPCRITVSLKDGRAYTLGKKDYEGFHTRPVSWQTVAKKFEDLSRPYAGQALGSEIMDAVSRLEHIQVAELTHLLAQVGKRR